MKIFTVYDSKAKYHSTPFFTATREAAERLFADSARDLKHPIGLHPEDYFLFEIGDFDEKSGLIAAFDGVKLVAEAQLYVKNLGVFEDSGVKAAEFSQSSKNGGFK